MAAISPSSDPPAGMGLTSLILGSVGLLLFFMPVLGIPLGVAGLAFGATGLVLATLGWSSLRWAVAGIVISVIALGIGVAIVSAPSGSLPNLKRPPVEHNIPNRPHVPSESFQSSSSAAGGWGIRAPGTHGARMPQPPPAANREAIPLLIHSRSR